MDSKCIQCIRRIQQQYILWTCFVLTTMLLHTITQYTVCTHCINNVLQHWLNCNLIMSNSLIYIFFNFITSCYTVLDSFFLLFSQTFDFVKLDVQTATKRLRNGKLLKQFKVEQEISVWHLTLCDGVHSHCKSQSP